jgi:hypothetical protein
MLTREEQIVALEESFNNLIVRIREAEQRGWNDTAAKLGQRLVGISAALTYLRTCIPNPHGRVEPSKPRERKLVL